MSISGHRSPAMFSGYNITDVRDQRPGFQQVQEYRKNSVKDNVAAWNVKLNTDNFAENTDNAAF